MKKSYTVKYRRKREGKTDYKLRLKLLVSKRQRIVVRKMLNNFSVQFVELDKKGDKTVVSSHSRELLKYGWKGHRGNIPSAYLVGYLCGLKAKKNGLVDGVVDFGLAGVVRGSSFFGAIKGLVDAGIKVNCSTQSFPSEDTINCGAIASYARELSNNKDLYLRQFSSYIKLGIKPEELSKYFEEVKKKIAERWH